MRKSFNKTGYESNLGYILNHTSGFSAEDSTLSYPHQTPMCMMYYFIHGSGNIKIEGKHYNINDGDMVILNPAEMFCCSVDPDKYHERIVLHFSENLLKNFPKNCTSLYSPFLNREKGVSNHISSDTAKKYSLDVILKNMLQITQSNNPASEILTLCKITELLSVLCKVYEENDNEKTVQSTENPFINKILEFLNTNFTKEMSIESIAREFNIDKSYLSHLFKEHVGISVWNYVIFRRISFFNDLINNGINIEEASLRSGFNNYSNFFRLYKKHTGITPTEYKKQKKM